MPTFKYSIIPNDFENAGYISSRIKKMLAKDGVSKELIRRVAIASYEAEVNVVIHSKGGYCEIVYILRAFQLSDDFFRGFELHGRAPGRARKYGDVHDIDRKSTRLNSSHQIISYAVF